MKILKTFENYNREQIARELEIDSNEFEDSANLGDLADELSNSAEAYEYILSDAQDLFDTYMENNDISGYLTPTLSSELAHSPVESIYNAVIKYYPQYEEEQGYIDSFNTEDFNKALKSVITAFVTKNSN